MRSEITFKNRLKSQRDFKLAQPPSFPVFTLILQPLDVSDFLFLILEQNDKKVGVERF